MIASSVRMPVPSGIGTPVIYPNPCQANLKIEFNVNMPSDVVVDLFDATGRKTGQLINDKLPPGRIFLDLDLSSYMAGVYYMLITDGRAHIVKKIVKINQ